MSANFVEWQKACEREQADRAAKRRKLGQRSRAAASRAARAERERKTKALEPTVRISRVPLPLFYNDGENRTMGDMPIATRVRVLERTADGSRAKIAVYNARDDAFDAEELHKKALGWVVTNDGSSAPTLLALSPRRLDVSLAPDVRAFIESKSESQKGEEEAWAQVLNTEAFRVMRMRGTEEAHSGKYIDHFLPGEYACAGCGRYIYSSTHKYESACGWPSFADNLPNALERLTVKAKSSSVKTKTEEIACASCGGHIGHTYVSVDAARNKRERHCANSVALRFVPRGSRRETQQQPIEAAPAATGFDLLSA